MVVESSSERIERPNVPLLRSFFDRHCNFTLKVTELTRFIGCVEAQAGTESKISSGFFQSCVGEICRMEKYSKKADKCSPQTRRDTTNPVTKSSLSVHGAVTNVSGNL